MGVPGEKYPRDMFSPGTPKGAPHEPPCVCCTFALAAELQNVRAMADRALRPAGAHA